MIRFPPAAGVRPTPDRVRETLFNWLGQDLSGRRCLDPYAGSGALTLEAASRGAALAVAVDRNRELVDALRATATALGATVIEAVVGDARTFIANERRDFDVIFLDPPFGDESRGAWLLPGCAERLLPGGFLSCRGSEDARAADGFRPWRRDKAGQVHYHLFIRAEAA